MGFTENWIKIDGEIIKTITLNRPDVHNPFDDRMVEELLQTFQELGANRNVKAVIITGAGKSFSAGADLNWMKRLGSYTMEENREDASKMSEMFKSLWEIPVPTIARLNGAAFGGGAGLACACDIVVASEEANIGFTEVRLGLIPAVISPYVIERVGAKTACRLFMTGERLNAHAAKECGLVDLIVPRGELDKAVSDIVDMILAGGPEAVKACKRLVRMSSIRDMKNFRNYCVDSIAAARSSDEGKEGISAFLEKREPSWRRK